MEYEIEELAAKYRVVLTQVRQEEETVFTAKAPELGDCSATGASRAAALEKIEQEILARLENMKQDGVTPPVPIDEQDFDGALSIKVSPTAHRELAFKAAEAEMTPEALAAELLATAVSGGWRHGHRSGGGGARRDGGGNRRRRGNMDDKQYHGIMENRAEFMEYVRRLERDGGGRGGSRGGGRRGSGRPG